MTTEHKGPSIPEWDELQADIAVRLTLAEDQKGYSCGSCERDSLHDLIRRCGAEISRLKSELEQRESGKQAEIDVLRREMEGDCARIKELEKVQEAVKELRASLSKVQQETVEKIADYFEREDKACGENRLGYQSVPIISECPCCECDAVFCYSGFLHARVRIKCASKTCGLKTPKDIDSPSGHSRLAKIWNRRKGEDK